MPLGAVLIGALAAALVLSVTKAPRRLARQGTRVASGPWSTNPPTRGH